jgi:hypothetical protein
MNILTPALLAAALWAALPGVAGAQQFSLESAVVDSRSGNQLGVVNERGELASLFRAQKALTFGILRSAGISLDQMSPELRARIERLQTTNVDAFRAFAEGLDLKDQGRFTEAREQFRRALELDPGFELAAQQQQAMPDVNLTSAVQLRAVLAQAATSAVERGRAVVAVDLARAAAALQSGLTVVSIPAGSPALRADADDPLRNRSVASNLARTASQVVGLAYTLVDGAIGVSTILPNEWRASEVAINTSGALLGVGSLTSSVQLRQAGAAATPVGRAELEGGGVAYWGAWLSSPTGSAVLRSGSTELRSPALGERIDWIAADTPLTLPGSGNFEYTPRGGGLQDVTGTLRVETAARRVSFNDLGFRIGSLAFSGLAGEALYDNRPDRPVASAPFSGNYSAGSCPACAGFVAGSSVFTGNFVGREAGGIVFSTVMVTGPGSTASGVHLFTRPATPVGRGGAGGP